MTSASNQQITRCPKCGTAFRITRTQLQSANGAVRCGSCLNVFKAMDYLVTPATPKAAAPETPSETGKTTASAPQPAPKPPVPKPAAAVTPQPKPQTIPEAGKPPAIKPAAPVEKPKPTPTAQVMTPATVAAKQPEQLAILSSIKPLPVTPPPAAAPVATTPPPATKKPVVRVLDKSSLEHVDDILISDDMDEKKEETKSYEFDSFMDIDMTPKAEISLFERKIRDQEDEDQLPNADESWAEMLIEEEDDDTPKYTAQRNPIIEDEGEDLYVAEQIQASTPATPVIEKRPTPAPGLTFSLIGEEEDTSITQQASPPAPEKPKDDFVLSNELANIPDHSGFNQTSIASGENPLDPDIFETPETDPGDEAGKRQIKTQPKLRAYDGSRTALLMNIIPAPIEFTAKRMRRWYQRKLWPALSLLALIALVTQLAWFKFDYFSRVEPYRTAYLFLCPYLGCQVPTLVDTRQISAFNLVVREHPDTTGALAVDVMIMNNAPFDQPYPDLVLVFTDLDDNEVASRRFSPKEYLGGEAAGSSYMPQKQPVYLTLDLVDPGENAVNYNIRIPRQ